MNIFSLSLAIYGILNIKKIGNLKIFILLPILSFIDSFSLILLTQILDHKNAFLLFSEYFQLIFLNYELAIIIIFYLNTIFKIKNKLINSVPIITASLLLALRYFSGQNIVDNYLPIFVATEALIVDICFVFLISKKIKEDKTILDISENQINKGFFLFVNTTAPYYLVINYINYFQERSANFLNFIGSFGYIILFYHIYKAIKCSLLK
jgi:hypothetical protein